MPNDNQIISWEAPEFREYEKTSGWYISLVAAAILIVGFFFIQKDWFGGITIAIIAVFLWIFSKQKPRVMVIQLTPTKLVVGNVQFPYKQLKYFWIVSNRHHYTVNFETTTVINNSIVIELLDQNEHEIREFLLRYLPEHTSTTETLAQRIMHKLKF